MTRHPLHFHRDSQHALHAQWQGEEPTGHLLAQFFESDLAADSAYADRLLAEGNALAKAGKGVWSTTGNAFAVNLSPQQAIVRSLFGHHEHREHRLPIAEFLDLLRKWRTLQGPAR